MVPSLVLSFTLFLSTCLSLSPLYLEGNDIKFLIRCKVSNSVEQEFLEELVDKHGIDVWDHHLVPKALNNLTILATPSGVDLLSSKLNCGKAISIKDFEKNTKEKATLNPNDDPFFSDYRTFGDIQRKLYSYQYRHSYDYGYGYGHGYDSELEIKVESVAHSHENREISAIRISLNSSSSSPSPSSSTETPPTPKRKIWVSCGQHAREWIAPASCMYLIDQVITKYGKQNRITEMLKEFELLVLPLVNPDGYEFSRKSYRYWRKNRRPNGDNIFGVDLNRNWPSRWGAMTGASDNPVSDVYRGPGPGSEPEVSGIINYIALLGNISAGVDVHSFGELILRNYGWTADPSPDEKRLARIGDKVSRNMNSLMGSDFVSQRSGQLYSAAGSMDDWIYDTTRAVGMTFELRDKGTFGFLLPPKYIIPTGQELVEGILTLSEAL